MSKVTIQQFREQRQPARGSKLDPLHDEILELKEEGYSLDQIMEFLALNNVQVAKSTLHSFIKKRVSGIKVAKVNAQINKKMPSKLGQNKTEFKDFNPPSWADPATKIDDLI